MNYKRPFCEEKVVKIRAVEGQDWSHADQITKSNIWTINIIASNKKAIKLRKILQDQKCFVFLLFSIQISSSFSGGDRDGV